MRHDSVTDNDTLVVDRMVGRCGELVLRRVDSGAAGRIDYEVIANGVFLMDTRNGESERLLVRAAADAMPAPGRVLIGGLGVGFSLREALDHPATSEVVVVEREAAVIGWNRGPLRDWHGNALADPRVRVIEADLLDWLRTTAENDAENAFDAVCLDIDNGPEWTVSPDNAELYRPAGLDLVADRLSPRGVLSVWSAGASPAFETRLRSRFPQVQTLPVPVPRGEPDVVWLATR